MLNPILAKAISVHQNHQFDDAVSAYKEYLKQFPDDAQAWYLLGTVRSQQKDNRVAIECIYQAIKLNPNSAQYFCSLGMNFEALSEYQKSEQAYLTAIEMRSDVYQVYFDYGCFLHNRKRYSEAIDCFEKSIKINPEHAPSYVSLGGLYQQAMNLVEAEKYSAKALQLLPQSELANNNYAKVLVTQEKFEKAKVFALKAVALQQKFIPALITLGSINYSLADKNEAELIFNNILKLDPTNLQALSLLAKCLIDKEQFIRAEELLQKALNLDKNDLGSMIHLSELYSAQDKFNQAWEVINDGLEKHSNSAELHFAIGIIHSQLGEFESARENYLEALELDNNYLEALHAITKITKYTDLDSDETQLAFSLVEKLQDNSFELSDNNKICLYFSLGKIFDDVSGYKDAFKYYQLGNQIKYSQNNYQVKEFIDFNQKNIKTFRSELFGKGITSKATVHPTVFIVGMPRSGSTLLEQILSSHSKVYAAGELSNIQTIVKQLHNYPIDLQQLTKNQTEAVIQQYDKDTKRFDLKSDIAWITDKNPINFRYIGLIKALFSNAKIIHLRRHPLDVVLSIFSQRFSKGHSYAFNLEAIALYFQQYNQLMEFWEGRYPESIKCCRYDDLIVDTKTTTTSILNYLNLDWEEACSNFHKQKRKVNTASTWQVRQPIYKGSINRWKNYSAQLSIVQKLLDVEIESWNQGCSHKYSDF